MAAKKKENEKRLSNEALMLKLVKAKAGKKKIEAEFRPRYEDADEEFFQKRIAIYRRIAENAIKAEEENKEAANPKASTEKVRG